MWCRPVPSAVSPMYMPGRLRTASRPFSTLMLFESYSPPLLLSLLMRNYLVSRSLLNADADSESAPRAGRIIGPKKSDPHRHDDIFVVVTLAHGDERAGVGIAEGQDYLIGGQVVQDIEQIGDVKTDVERLALVRDLEFLLSFLLFAVRADDLELV